MAHASLRLMNLRPMLAASAVCALAFPLAGCNRAPATGAQAGGPPAAQVQPAAGSAPLAHATEAAPVPAPDSPDLAPTSAAEQPPAVAVRPEPSTVLLAWGTAIERRNWAAVRALWGNHGADSGLTRRDFALRWDRLRHPHVTVGAGQQEGAAGSLYYTAPVTIQDGARTIASQVTIRRANDVPGATPEQLRWHLDATTREPWTRP